MVFKWYIQHNAYFITGNIPITGPIQSQRISLKNESSQAEFLLQNITCCERSERVPSHVMWEVK